MNLLHNGLVAQRPPADQALLLRRCEPVELKAGEVLSAPGAASGHVHFLLSGASVAMVVRHGGGGGLAVGLTGREGAVGLQFALGLGAGHFTWLVQSSGAALQRLSNRRLGMLRTFAGDLWGVSQEVAELAASAQVQDIQARLARWILLSQARTHQTELHLTHVHLADMLGVRRAGITQAANNLKDLGLVDYRRGRIQILNLAGLAAVAHAPQGAPEGRDRDKK
ncbi:Crp/Fnr family transcriptional regulator [Hydrogenophaga sp. SL48]|uniref:Crp/Fnr family transcriptional regulator n=1 Tax=Hydrogenophaga sp. SL48 TaxID=2806347 RepID=UPI001F2A8BA9|nr:Crp/Fnr family transcriptional regulator [Hydrogenophaga sp. SL48]UJW79761.1 Crp/Fnr family transcriptional regulator [Hydrogenophaga sp. SL48]